MKRRYKEGDWFRIPLDSQYDALGVIARACRSRLFGYFFRARVEATPTHDELKALRASGAVACALFGGAALEEMRWTVIATSVPFDRRAWPFPRFASRGAFGRTWSSRTYDPQIMQIVRTDEIDEATALTLPDARFATAGELEALLRERICGIPQREPLAIYELQTGFDPKDLHLVSNGGRVQFSEPLGGDDLAILAGFIAKHHAVELRVHGFLTQVFDLRTLSRLGSLRALTLDARRLENSEGLAVLTNLQRLCVGPLDTPLALAVLRALPSLRALEVHGGLADIDAVKACANLEELTLVDVPALDLAELASSQTLNELAIAHSAIPLNGVREMRTLGRLQLRDMQLSALPDLSKNVALRALSLRNVTLLRDLRALASAPALHELEISGMPQLDVRDFEPLAGCTKLQRLSVDIGSRSKSREVYRMVHLGKKKHEVLRHRYGPGGADGVDDAGSG